ncbi:efflux transporter outer membrane factor lipoprotein [Clostridium sp. CAG:768]|nr:efflux transporter outer membrane factor lipoprotein [Clostridium sp. CAG:768]
MIIKNASTKNKGLKKVKKLLSTALLMSFLSMNIMPVFALENNTKSTATPKQFKSMVEKSNKKTKPTNKNNANRKNDDYKFAYVNMNWWNNFNDDILTSYIEKAILNNYDLKMATINVEEYYQNVKLQFANELPSVAAGFGPGWYKAPGSTSTDIGFGLPIIVQYEADIFLKNHNKTKAVKKLYEGSKLDERAAYISVVSAVGSTYFNIINLDKMITLQEQIVKIRQEIYDLMLASNKEGLTSTADTVKANKSLVQGQTDLIELKKQREQLLHQMCVLIGESPENANTLKRTSLDDVNYQLAVPSQIPSEIITQRPDYMRAELMVEKAGIDVKVAKKEFLPSINILGGALFNAGDLGSLFTTKNMLLGLGGGLMTPLFQGGSLIANLRLKKATYERILQDYYKTNLTAIQEVNDALVASKLDKEKMLQTTKQYNLEKSDYKYSEHKYNQGIISKLDLIQYQENLLTIEKLVAQQKVECMTDAISLYKATGSKPYDYVN